MAEREDHVPNRALLRKRFAQYEKLAEELCRRAKRPETVARLKRLRARLRQGPVRLLVVGVSCSGKSTLINALSGEFVAPEGDYVTSCVPLWVSGREPDPEDNGPMFYALYWGEDGSFDPRLNNQTSALTKLCHVPGHRAQVPENLEAMTAQVGGGFLWESGLTLVDTPGIGQQAADDSQTRTAIDRGAELLLIVHRAPTVSDGNGDGSGISDAAFLQSLFPRGAQDLHLDMKRDLFLLGNNVLNVGGKGSEASIQEALKKLVSKWNMSGERCFYWVDVLRQRQRVGYYRYNDWFPDGADKRAFLPREREDRHAWEQLLEARRQAGPSAGEEAQIEAEEELKTQELLKEAVDEEGRQNILRRAVLRKRRALRDSRNMENLRQALTDRALELYEDPDRLCAPIEEELRQAVREMAEDCRGRMDQKKQKIERELAAIPDERVTSRVLNELRDKEKRLNAVIRDLSQASDWLEEQMRQFVQEQAREQERYQNSEGVLTRAVSADYENETWTLRILATTVIENAELWKKNTAKSLTDKYVQCRTRVQTDLAEGKVSLAEGLSSPEQWAQRLEEIVKELNRKLPTHPRVRRFDCEKLFRPDRRAFLTPARERVQTEVRELKKKLLPQLTEMLNGKPAPAAKYLQQAVGAAAAAAAKFAGPQFYAAGLRAREVLSREPSVERDFTYCMKEQMKPGVKQDVAEYIRYQKDCGAKQIKELKEIRHELCRQGEYLSDLYRENEKKRADVLAQARKKLLQQRLGEELAPLKEEFQFCEQLSKQKNWMEVSV